MSWAAFRETTRPEDQAYCLMGIFNVSMPPIYGEGRAKAFMRLQQEIIKISDDRSIFAWTSNSRDTGELRGLLARSPEEFRASGGVKISETDLIGDASSFSFANNGLRIHLPIVSTDDLEVGDSFLASLHCQTEKDGITSHLSIFLRRIGEKKYVRYRPNMVALMPSRSDSQDLKEVIVKENSLPRKTRRKSHGPSPYIFHLKVLPPAQCLLDMDNIRHSGTAPGNAPGNAPGPSEAVRYDGNGTKIEVSEDAFAQLHLTYHDGQLSRLFYVAFGVQNNISTIDVIPEQLHRDHSTLINDIPVDRASLHLTNLGLLTVSLQMTGRYSARVLEINYHRFMDQESSEKTLQTKLQPPSLGFRVPLFIQYYFYESALLSLTDVFPPSFFDRGLKSSRSSESYIAMHPNIPFRLLTYKDDKFNLKLHVAIGFQATGDAWTDIFTHERFDVDEQKKHEDIWKSYFDSGLWRQVSSQSTSSDILFGWNVTATVQSSRTLQLGSHSLLLRID
ncbi:hypothetical protein VKT23_008031 [Stygiomarasmius scandens]|uniref:Uncharacterized protein n=1 Tax=Marasmiellus scandens TaxID=2682957 RepID=A0ABR1JJP6_9AGAR